jgi:3D (Asp-Asp-Asp) domain-containing protein
MLLKNHTGETSRVGYTVIADPKNPSAVEYAGEVYVEFNDSHYIKDTMGSKTENIK